MYSNIVEIVLHVKRLAGITAKEKMAKRGYRNEFLLEKLTQNDS
jgi:hypothetical protein